MKTGVAFIGFGTIAADVAAGLRAQPDYHMAALCRRRDAALDTDVKRLADLRDLLAWQPALVVEAAGQAAVHEYVETCLLAGIPVIVTSAGALADEACRDRLTQAARAGRTRLIIPSGAVGGLDYLRAVHQNDGAQVTYESRKPPLAWEGELAALGHDAAALTDAVILYEGDAATAAQRYPQNLNVAATLALAGGGMQKTRVRVIADPGVKQNQHTVNVDGPLGRCTITLTNQPSPRNPKTSWVVAQSVLATIRRQFDPLWLG